jgi:hypothetical protein
MLCKRSRCRRRRRICREGGSVDSKSVDSPTGLVRGHAAGVLLEKPAGDRNGWGLILDWQDATTAAAAVAAAAVSIINKFNDTKPAWNLMER